MKLTLYALGSAALVFGYYRLYQAGGWLLVLTTLALFAFCRVMTLAGSRFP